MKFCRVFHVEIFNAAHYKFNNLHNKSKISTVYYHDEFLLIIDKGILLIRQTK